MAARVFDLLEEPRGDVLRRLLRSTASFATSAMLVLRDDLQLSEAGQSLLGRLQPHRLETRRGSAWPGTVLLGSEATLLRFALTEPVLEALLGAAEGLYGWQQPALPEDLALVRADGTVCLASISHERDAFLELTDGEYASLVKAVPELTTLARPRGDGDLPRAGSMNASPHRVGIVLDPEFGKQLSQLARQLHIWVVDSDTNGPAIRDFWANEPTSEETDDPIATGITSFAAIPGETREDTCVRLLDTVDDHHGDYAHDPPWSEIEIHGLTLTPRLESLFTDFGAEEFTSTASGFIVRRPVT